MTCMGVLQGLCDLNGLWGVVVRVWVLQGVCDVHGSYRGCVEVHGSYRGCVTCMGPTGCV